MTPRWILTALVLCWLGSVSAHAETIQVTIDKLVFSPTEVNAKVGDTIVWNNKDILAHTATADNKDLGCHDRVEADRQPGAKNRRQHRLLLQVSSQHEGTRCRRAPKWRGPLLKNKQRPQRTPYSKRT